MTDFATRAELIASYTYGQEQPYWAFISQEDRDRAASSGAAMPDGSYPIFTCSGDNSVDSAIHAVGRGSGGHDAIRKHIMKRAKSLGCSSKIPDNWNSDGSLKAGAEVSALADTATAPGPSAADKAPAPAKEPAADETGPDNTTASKIDAAVTAVQAAIDAQTADPDNKTDPNDQAVMSDLQNAADYLQKAVKDQKADEAGDEKAAPPAEKPAPAAKPAPAPAQTAAGAMPPVKTPPPAAEGDAPKTEPVPATGDQDPDVKCATPGCEHVAAVHQNTGEGDNTGACTTPGCDCKGLTAQSNAAQETPGQVDDTQSEGAEGVALADMPIPPASLPKPVEPTGATEESNQPPAIEPATDIMGPAFTIPCGVIEGQPTGDGREIAPNALTWRTPPMPLMFMPSSSHDPSGMSPNDPARICGRIDSLERVPGENGTQIITAKGFFLQDFTGAAELLEQMGRVGISADIAANAVEMTPVELDDTGFPIEMSELLTEGVIMGFTMLPFPAFAGCYIVLGDGTDMEPIPQQTDDQTASGQRIHWMTFEECRACDTPGEVLVAAGGPVRPPASWFADPQFEDGDGRLEEIYTRGHQTQLACPLTITDDGRIFGHIAPWGVCHASFPGKCITPPHSQTDYAHFKRGEVLCAEGEYLPVGVITADTNHASLSAGPTGAMQHYEDTGLIAAWVNAGQDAYGIWVAGAIDPDATEAQVSRLRACGISGDWRNGELVAALSVPVPGYPLARVQGRRQALIASGAQVMFQLAHPAAPEDPNVDHALRASLAPLVAESGKLARGRIGARVSEQAARARNRIARR